MTVKSLLLRLSDFEPDAEVFFMTDAGGYTIDLIVGDREDRVFLSEKTPDHLRLTKK